MHCNIFRFAYTPAETQGRFVVGDWSCFTIERPWRRWVYPGGQPFKSCIPDGEYRLIPHERPNGDRVFALVNEHAGVYRYKEDRPGDDGRYLILIHHGNYVDDVVGCIAPGRNRMIAGNRLMVTHSRATMRDLLSVLDWTQEHTLRIQPMLGAIDTPLQ